MPRIRTREEIDSEIDDAYDFGDFDHAKHMEAELEHDDRLEAMAKRMEAAGYEPWEIAEEIEEADASWHGARAHTESMRRTGTFIPTAPRIPLDQPRPEGASAQDKRQGAVVEGAGLVKPPFPAERLLGAFRESGGACPTQALRASWEWVGKEERLCLAFSFRTTSGGAILRSSQDITLRAAWPDGPWKGDAIGADGWEDLTQQEAAEMARSCGLDPIREFAVEHAEALVAAPAEREASAFEAMLGDATAKAARENAPLAQQGAQAPERAR